MRKKLSVSFIVLLLILTSISLVSAYTVNDVYYTTEHGVELTKAQYDNLTKVFTPEELDCLAIPAIEEMKNDTKLKLLDSSEVCVVTKTRYDENNKPVETINKEVSEAEAKRIAAELKKNN
ncbi:hypothetical protein [Emergencia timonensis]|uniref:hypothetical protein n=1 Tax=Emergencia timonensis TaxID=1776384 RepID=UPI0039963683